MDYVQHHAMCEAEAYGMYLIETIAEYEGCPARDRAIRETVARRHPQVAVIFDEYGIKITKGTEYSYVSLSDDPETLVQNYRETLEKIAMREMAQAGNRLAPDFFLAGKATFTVSNGSEHYTYRIHYVAGTEKYPESWFIMLFTGRSNQDNYTYMGKLDPETGSLDLTRAARYRDDSLPVKVARWALSLCWQGKPLPKGYTIQHSGSCGRCGRQLTHPDSLATGLGPECASKARGASS